MYACTLVLDYVRAGVFGFTFFLKFTSKSKLIKTFVVDREATNKPMMNLIIWKNRFYILVYNFFFVTPGSVDTRLG